MMEWSSSQTKVAIGISFSWLFCCSLYAQTTLPHTFSNGSPADADQVNENFESLRKGINALEDFMDVSNVGVYGRVVDCSEDPSLLQGALDETKHLSRVSIGIKGTCELPHDFRIWSKFLAIGGDCDSGEAALVSAAHPFWPDSQNRGANLSASLGSSLWLTCLRLGTSESNLSTVWSDTGSHIRLSNITGRGDGFRITHRGNSTLNLVGAMEGLTAIYVESSHLSVQGPFAPQEETNIPVLSLQDGSRFVCTFCYGQIGWLGLTMGSSALIKRYHNETFGGELLIDNAVLHGMSKLLIEHRGEPRSISPVTIVNASTDEGSVIETSEYLRVPAQ